MLNFPSRIIVALALVMPLSLSACRIEQPAPLSRPAPQASPTGNPPSPSPTAELPGQVVYTRYCAACHGADGIAVASAWTPNLNSQGLLTVVDDQFLYDNTALGRPGENGRGQSGTKMPAYRDLMSEEDLWAVVAYMRHWQTEPSITLEPFTANGDREAGQRIYEVTCAACHGPDGWGDLAPRLAGEIFHLTYSDAHIRHVVLHGRPGTTMPPHLLSDTDLNDLVTFVRTLGKGDADATVSP